MFHVILSNTQHLALSLLAKFYIYKVGSDRFLLTNQTLRYIGLKIFLEAYLVFHEHTFTKQHFHFIKFS